MDLRALAVSKSTETMKLESGFKRVWGDDLEKKVKALVDLSPQYDDSNTILSDPDIMNKFLNMTQKSFLALGPLAREVRSAAALLRKTQFLSADMCDNAEKMAARAAEVVAFKYVIEHTQNVWTKITNPADCAEAVAKLRKALEHPLHLYVRTCAYVSGLV